MFLLNTPGYIFRSQQEGTRFVANFEIKMNSTILWHISYFQSKSYKIQWGWLPGKVIAMWSCNPKHTYLEVNLTGLDNTLWWAECPSIHRRRNAFPKEVPPRTEEASSHRAQKFTIQSIHFRYACDGTVIFFLRQGFQEHLLWLLFYISVPIPLDWDMVGGEDSCVPSCLNTAICSTAKNFPFFFKTGSHLVSDHLFQPLFSICCHVS